MSEHSDDCAKGLGGPCDCHVMMEGPEPAPKVVEPPKKNCHACRHSGMEPDDERLFCGHPDVAPYGRYLKWPAVPHDHCGPQFSKFEQHPNRNPDGTLKS